MSDLMEVANSPTAGEARGALTTLVVEAYDSPRYQTPEFAERSIRDFENKTYLVCIKTLG